MKHLCTGLALALIVAVAGCKSDQPNLSKEQLEKARAAYNAIRRLEVGKNGSQLTYDLLRVNAKDALNDLRHAPVARYSSTNDLLDGVELEGALDSYFMSVEISRQVDRRAYVTQQVSDYADAKRSRQRVEGCRIAAYNRLYTPIETSSHESCSFDKADQVGHKATSATEKN